MTSNGLAEIQAPYSSYVGIKGKQLFQKKHLANTAAGLIAIWSHGIYKHELPIEK